MGWDPSARPEPDGARCGQANFQQKGMLGPVARPDRAKAREARPRNSLASEYVRLFCYDTSMRFLFRFVAVALAVYLTVNLVPGISMADGWMTLLVVAAVWSVIITVVKPVLSILSFPITLITLGLFNFVLNALLFWGMELIVPGFDVAGWWPALLGSLALSVFSWVIEKVF